MLSKRGKSLPKALVAAFGIVALGSSRPLGSKTVQGTWNAPTDILAREAPKLVLAEDPNNQGCFTKKELNGMVVLQLQNNQSVPIVIDESVAVFFVDGKAYPARQRHYSVGGTKKAVPFGTTTIPSAGRGEVILRTQRFLSADDLKRVSTVDVRIPLNSDTLTAHFDRLREVPVKEGIGDSTGEF
jgi:hypothetical protein